MGLQLISKSIWQVLSFYQLIRVSVHKNGMCFHLFTSFNNILKFIVYKFFIYFVKLIPKYFIFADVIINGSFLNFILGLFISSV